MKWLFVRRLRPFVALAALLSLGLNLALLMPAIYMMQVFDRVFASGSVETLVMLSAVTLLFLVLAYFLDTVRTRSLAWLAARSTASSRPRRSAARSSRPPPVLDGWIRTPCATSRSCARS